MARKIPGKSAWDVLSRATSILDTGGWNQLGKAGIGTIFLSTVVLGVDIMRAIVDVPVTIAHSLAEDVAFLNSAIFRAPAQFLSSAVDAGASSFGSGWTALLGPFQGPFGVALTIVMIWEVAYYLDYVDTDVVGVALNLPFINSDDSGAAGDED